jgi:hypothetical protein
MSMAMMMIKGWRVSWMPIMLWNYFIEWSFMTCNKLELNF